MVNGHYLSSVLDTYVDPLAVNDHGLTLNVRPVIGNVSVPLV